MRAPVSTRSARSLTARHVLKLVAGETGCLEASLPAGLAGQWCVVRLRGQQGPVRLSLTDRQRGQVVREVFLGGAADAERRQALVHVPAQSGAVVFEIFGAVWRQPEADMCRLPRLTAALRLAVRALPSLPRAMLGSPLGLSGRLRARIGRASLQRAAAPGYDVWLRLYDTNGQTAGDPAAACLPADALAAVVIDDPNVPALLRLTLRSLDGQPSLGRCHLVRDLAGWRTALEQAGERPLVVLQAGECLAPGAPGRLSTALGTSDLASGDDDQLTAVGSRAKPHFKPQLGRALLRSFTLSSGVMALRPRLLAGLQEAALAHADLIRYAACLRLFTETAEPCVGRVQSILSHRHVSTATPSNAVAETLLRQHLAALGVAGDIRRTAYGLRVRPVPLGRPGVGIVVASACRSRHVLACVRRVVEGTDYPIAAVVVAVSDPHPSPAQRRVMASLARLPRVRVMHCPMAEFDFARVNALAAASLRTELLLLLNDDVSPVEPGWLGCMVAHLDDPSVGIVGARLLYGDGTVQHAGVVIGLAHLCEHNDRFRSPGDPGPFGSVLLDRDVSAVTGACLLIRRSLWQRLGGFDPAFSIALNDVDLCLRARQAGIRVVYAASAVLHHYESLSLGRHYAGARAEREGVEVRLLAERWSAVMQDDPFYNRNLSHEIGREWQPAFPPRPAPSGDGPR